MKVGDRVKVVEDFIGEGELVGLYGKVVSVFHHGLIIDLDSASDLFFDVDELEVVA